MNRGDVDLFAFLTAASRNASFGQVKYDGTPLLPTFGLDSNGSFRSHFGQGLFRNLSYGTNVVELINLLALPGDTDGDQDIDITDFNRLAANFDPAPVTPHDWPEGDFDGDIDITDFNALVNNFAPMGYSGPGNAPGQVPEPSTIVLCMLGLVGAAMFVRGRREDAPI